MSLLNEREEAKHFTQPAGSEANGSVETFNSLLASRAVSSEEPEVLWSIQQKGPRFAALLQKPIHGAMEKRGEKKELKKGKTDAFFSNLGVAIVSRTGTEQTAGSGPGPLAEQPVPCPGGGGLPWGPQALPPFGPVSGPSFFSVRKRS